MPEKSLTILVVAVDAVGHFNACIGIAEQLRDRGHKIVFAVPDSWKNKLSSYGFIEEWYNPKEPTPKDDSDKYAQMVAQIAPVFLTTPLEQLKTLLVLMFGQLFKQIKENHPRLVEIVAKVKPDLILANAIIHQPAIMDAGIPWIFCHTVNPCGLSDKNVPPAFSGYPTEAKDKKSWELYLQEYKSAFKSIYAEVNAWVKENGGPDIPFYDQPYFVKYSPYANIYMFPQEMDYTGIRPNPPKFHQFDNFMRSGKGETFEIPESLQGKPGKLIYFSMGTIGSSEIGLMKRLIGILAKSPHRFIVPKGTQADKIQLADNMWGQAYLPQTKILPLVDLVITNGGTNTVVESFHFGKPLIVLPLLGVHPANAQRVQETGVGIRLHPYQVTEKELLDAIETVLGNVTMGSLMTKIGIRIQASNNGPARVADLVQDIIKNNTN